MIIVRKLLEMRFYSKSIFLLSSIFYKSFSKEVADLIRMSLSITFFDASLGVNIVGTHI